MQIENGFRSDAAEAGDRDRCKECSNWFFCWAAGGFGSGSQLLRTANLLAERIITLECCKNEILRCIRQIRVFVDRVPDNLVERSFCISVGSCHQNSLASSIPTDPTVSYGTDSTSWRGSSAAHQDTTKCDRIAWTS